MSDHLRSASEQLWCLPLLSPSLALSSLSLVLRHRRRLPSMVRYAAAPNITILEILRVPLSPVWWPRLDGPYCMPIWLDLHALQPILLSMSPRSRAALWPRISHQQPWRISDYDGYRPQRHRHPPTRQLLHSRSGAHLAFIFMCSANLTYRSCTPGGPELPQVPPLRGHGDRV